MKLPKKCKIEAAASDDARSSIKNPYLDISDKSNPVIVSTDGRIMAILPVIVDEGDVSGYVTSDSLSMARKITRTNEVSIHCNGELKIENGPSFPRPEGSYPNWRLVLPPKEESGVKHRVKINSKLLSTLASAMGCECVELVFRDNESAIEVIPVGTKTNLASCEKAVGLLMPLRD